MRPTKAVCSRHFILNCQYLARGVSSHVVLSNDVYRVRILPQLIFLLYFGTVLRELWFCFSFDH
jgi:hypothetical protein